MQYLGGKSKISNEIATIINNVLTVLGGGYMRYLGGKSRISTQLSNVVDTIFEREREREYSYLSFVGLVLLSQK